jgi:predicted DCC family thiol-disulfide oxidoreductase YuxK
MRYIILFDGNCRACSKVARMVRDLGVSGLEARSLEDPEVALLLGPAGLETPDRPALVVAESNEVQLLRGWAMRRRLARVIGWRRSGAIVSLAAAEWRARVARSADAHAPSRRTVIGGALAAAAGWVLMPGSASASSQPSGSKTITTVADPAEVRAALATAPGQRAITTWGPVGQKAYKISGGGQDTLMLTHPQSGIVTYMDMAPEALRGGNPAAVSTGAAPATENTIRHYTVGGTPLADLTISGTGAKSTAVASDAIVPSRTAAPEEPDVGPRAIANFTACIGRKAGAACLQHCIDCVPVVYIEKNPLPCAQCLVCAGPHAISCAIEFL